ncbi:triphosphoribosyl-dephospho-CoA synthase [Dethiosulfovibrio salsuginis]|uniref:triphosphoribosyl-dephospho-CoA synthase n=1 Tax=Dethiosulfovibrio salsuginis TaxID=561720 RepID=A0A1X7JU11_9BACT|nr:triphosphoribosyl-dephospho-CoA synthase [Dethiosulfovibrio salsuginis]SMG31862.1 triphosphoribosyl-dephospho-CoA synthase [Dethiosulfovibrio salsuginis]
MYLEGKGGDRPGQGWAHPVVMAPFREAIADLAVRALIHEAAAHPKPGLVTSLSRGAHRDMDFDTFLSSALALRPFFAEVAQIGWDTFDQPPLDCLGELKRAGLAAEDDMRRATGGVNTHKGAIFSMGLMVAATSRGLRSGVVLSPEALTDIGASFVAGIVRRELGSIAEARSAGERLYLSRGVRGVRGEAEDGFPSALTALKVLRGRQDPLSSSSLCDGLLSVIALGGDTNVLHRGGETEMASLANLAKEAIDAGGTGSPPGREVVSKMESYCLKRWISPGGSADMLALAIYLLLVERKAPYLLSL